MRRLALVFVAPTYSRLSVARVGEQLGAATFDTLGVIRAATATAWRSMAFERADDGWHAFA